MPARPRGASGAIAPPSDISLKLNPKKIKKLIKTAENLAAVQTIQQTLKRLPLLPTAFASFTLKQNKPKDGAPTEGGPTEGAPKGGAPIDGAPKGGAPTGGAPIEGAPKGGVPIEGAPKGGAPIEGASIEGAPKGGAPIEGAPKGGGPVEGAPIRGIGGPPVGSEFVVFERSYEELIGVKDEGLGFGVCLLNELFILTKENMQDMYNQSKFLNKGWDDDTKKNELNNKHAHFWMVFNSSKQTRKGLGFRV